MEEIMKLSLTLLLLLISQLSFAETNLNCLGDSGETLTIFHSRPPVNRAPFEFPLDANVVLTVSGVNEIFKGTFTPLLNVYDLKDQNGVLVELKVRKPIRHGGRCGRCSPDPLPPSEQEIYAKLVFNQTELDFTCTAIK